MVNQSTDFSSLNDGWYLRRKHVCVADRLQRTVMSTFLWLSFVYGTDSCSVFLLSTLLPLLHLLRLVFQCFLASHADGQLLERQTQKTAAGPRPGLSLPTAPPLPPTASRVTLMCSGLL